MTNDPWYTRTEFWAKIGVMILGSLAATSPKLSPIIQNIGATAAGAAPLIYIWGRSNVKIAKAAAALEALGAGLQAPK